MTYEKIAMVSMVGTSNRKNLMLNGQLENKQFLLFRKS